MESVFMLYIEDGDGDEYVEGLYRTREIAEQKAEFIYEWDPSIRRHRVTEDFIRESADD